MPDAGGKGPKIHLFCSCSTAQRLMLGTAVFGFALGPSPLVYRVLIKRAACGHPLPLYIYKENYGGRGRGRNSVPKASNNGVV